MTKTILVAGGAGSHCTKALADAGFDTLVVDNLENGHSAFLKWGQFREADIRDRDEVDRIFCGRETGWRAAVCSLIEVKDSQDQMIRYIVESAWHWHSKVEPELFGQ